MFRCVVVRIITIIKPPRKIIKYRSFNEQSFKFTGIFLEILEKPAPLSSNKVRGNQVPLINKELSEVIMNKSRTKNRYSEWPSSENVFGYKKAKDKCNNSLTRKTKRKYFSNLGKIEGSQTSTLYWNLAEHFLTNKGAISNGNFVIKLRYMKLSKLSTNMMQSQSKPMIL